MATLLRRGDRELASSFRGDCRVEFDRRRAVRGGGALARADSTLRSATAPTRWLWSSERLRRRCSSRTPSCPGGWRVVVRYMRAGQIDVPPSCWATVLKRVARLQGLRIHDTHVRLDRRRIPDLRAAVSQMVARSIERTSSTDRRRPGQRFGEECSIVAQKGRRSSGNGPVSNEAEDRSVSRC